MGCRTCEKPKVSYRKGLWSPEEDRRLRDYILQHGISCWSAVPVKAGLQRNGKSCRLRWINYLRPGLKRGNFSLEEEEIVMKLQAKLGNKWSQIAMHLPGRTDNEVKNYWNSYLKKKVAKAQTSDSQVSLNSSSDCTNQIPIKQEEEPSDQKAAVEMNQSNSAELSNLPQVLSGDWLFLDHPNGDGLFSFDEVMNNTWPSSQVNGSESKQVGEGIFNGNGGTCMGNIQTQPDLMSQIPENGAFDLLFPTHIYDKFELYNCEELEVT